MRSRRSGRFGVATSGVVAIALAGSALVAPATAEAKPAEPAGYQVKLRVEPSVLDGEGNLTTDAAGFFGITGSAGQSAAPESEQSLYVDTADTAFSAKGWSIRLRHKDGDSDYDLTYKYRQRLGDNSLSQDSVDAGLAAAEKADFAASDDNYEPQVNASYSSSSVDFSNKKTAKCGDDCAIPAADAALELLDDELPGKFTEQVGATLADSGARVSQTVTQRTWPITVDTGQGDLDAELEVTAMSGGYYVEVTTETAKRGDAADTRAALIEALDGHGILEHSDAFKTGLVLAGSL